MNVLFIVERNLYYKFYGPIIEKFIREGKTVFLAHRRSDKPMNLKNQKLFYHPFLSQIPVFSQRPSRVLSFSEDDELGEIINTHKIDVTFSLSSRGEYRFSNRTNGLWCTLQHGIDSFVEQSFDSDAFFVYSKNWIKEDFQSKLLNCRVEEVGHYYVEEKEMDRLEILSKYNLDPKVKYLFFTPLPVNTGSSYTFINGFFRRRLMNRKIIKDEIKLLEFLNHELKNHGYQIIIKSRFKRFLSEEYHKVGHVFYDDQFYPSTLNELLYCCESALINFMPGAIVTECMTLKKNYTFLKNSKYLEEIFSHSDDYIKDIFLPFGKEKRVVEYSNKREIVDSIIANESFDIEGARSYISRYLRPNDDDGVEKIYKTILNMSAN